MAVIVKYHTSDSIIFSLYTCKPLGGCTYKKNSSHKWDITNLYPGGDVGELT